MSPPLRLAALTALALVAFAANSLLCRLALLQTGIDPARFTAIRLAAGALVLWLIVRARDGALAGAGSWTSASALFAYAAAFSFAYVSLPTGVGALLLFGAVQATMIGHGLARGERLARLQWLGLVTALAGLLGLLAPGLSAPPLPAAALMLAAGVAWGIYSLRGRTAGEATRHTAGNFLRALPMAALLVLVWGRAELPEARGVLYAIASGALASGLGYAIWYSVLPSLRASTAASLQLGVPVLAAVAGVLFLDEPVTLRLVLASLAVLGGVALVVRRRA